MHIPVTEIQTFLQEKIYLPSGTQEQAATTMKATGMINAFSDISLIFMLYLFISKRRR